MQLYPSYPRSSLTLDKERLEAIAAAVPPVPPELAGLSAPELQGFLAERHGGTLGHVLKQHAASSELDDAERLAVTRALDVHGFTTLFREPRTLRAFRQIVLPLFAERPEAVETASIGCSSGQELLSLVLTCWSKRDHLKLRGFDINPEHIEEARTLRWFLTNWYDKLQRIPRALCDSYSTWARVPERAWAEAFDITPSAKPGRVDLAPSAELRGRFEYAVHDILLAPLAQPHDVVIMQNVLCHYAPLGRHEIMQNVRRSLRDGGIFIGDAAHTLGHAAHDTKTFAEWYRALEPYGFERVELPIWADWAQKYFDETHALFVYRAA